MARSWLPIVASARSRVVVGRHQAAVLVPLEEQDPVAQHAGLGHALAEAGRHGAQVLADDEAAMTLALEGQDAQQVVERVGDVGALGRAGCPAGIQ